MRGMKGEWEDQIGRRGHRRLLQSCLGLWLLLGTRGSLGSIKCVLNNEVVCYAVFSVHALAQRVRDTVMYSCEDLPLTGSIVRATTFRRK